MSTAQGAAAGAIGGVVAGAGMALFMGTAEAKGFIPGPLPLKFNRALQDAAGIGQRLPPAAQQGIALAEHLILAAGLGAVYGVLGKAFKLAPLPSGPLYGLATYALMLGVVGPALGATERPSKTKATTSARRMLMHALYGTVTALVANQAARRLLHSR